MFYRIVKTLLCMYYHMIFRIHVIGVEEIPEQGAVILCANHINALDPFMIGISIKRKLRFMAKKELFDRKLVSWFLYKAGVFPIDRMGTDIEAIKTALSILKEGGVFGIFAQGTRIKHGNTHEAKGGVALLAVKGNAKVVPVGISSSYSLFSPITIRFGKPLSFEEYKGQRLSSEALGEITYKIMEDITRLLV
jgi:1-acyl-sn-glycerol-3-phosphate acyltransferase